MTVSIHCVVHEKDDFIRRWEEHLKKNEYPFTVKIDGAERKYVISVETPEQVFYLGCNCVAIANKLFDGPLTTTG